MHELLSKIQVNIPFRMLYENYLDRFIEHRINPEIGFDAAALEHFSFPEISRIADKLHEHALTITLHGPFIDLSPGSVDPAVSALTRRRFEQVLALVPLFKPKVVVCHAGYDWKRYGWLAEQWLQNSVKTWSWLAVRLAEEDVQLVLENVYEDGPEDILILFERLKAQNVGFCLDTGHQSAFGKASLDTWLTAMQDYLSEIHLHDNDGRRDSHSAMGHGIIDFHRLFNFLAARKAPPPIITLEPHEDEDLWTSLRYLEKVWPWKMTNDE